MRLLAFSFLVAAAFDWPTLWLDRAGLALVGLAFLSLTVGRSREGSALTAARLGRPLPVLGARGAPPEPPSAAERIGAYVGK